MLYPKIQSMFLRDPETKNRNFLQGKWSMPEFGLLAGVQWEWTEKVDGTNIRITWDGERVVFGGRKEKSQIHTSLINHLIATFPAERFLDAELPPMVLYGEGYGDGIQKGGGNYGPSQSFVLFDVFCGGLWLERSSVQDIGEALWIGVVPVVGTGTLYEAQEFVEASPMSMWGWGPFTAEGIVMRPIVELQTRRGERIITKLKVRDFEVREASR